MIYPTAKDQENPWGYLRRLERMEARGVIPYDKEPFEAGLLAAKKWIADREAEGKTDPGMQWDEP